MRRLPLDSAVVRSSKLGCPNVPNGCASISATSRSSCGQRQREGRADETAAGNRDVDVQRLDVEADAARSDRIHQLLDRVRLLSAAPAVSTSLPSPVTATSSSMRTPMFHQRFATPFAPAGM